MHNLTTWLRYRVSTPELYIASLCNAGCIVMGIMALWFVWVILSMKGFI